MTPFGILLIIWAMIGIWFANALTFPPKTASAFMNSFRSGEASIPIAGLSNLEVPYYTALTGGGSVGLALSLIDYRQYFDSTTKIWFLLIENTPTSSNSTHAVFQCQFGYPAQITRIRVKYLVCPTSLFNSNFEISTTVVNPPSPLGASANYAVTVNPSLASGSPYTVAVWFSGAIGIQASGVNMFLQVYFYNTPSNRVKVLNQATATMNIDQVRITLVFLSDSLATNGTYLFPLNKYLQFTSTTYSESVNTALPSWMDTSNVICGLYRIFIHYNYYDYTISQDGSII